MTGLEPVTFGKDFGSVRLLHDIALSVETGEITG